MQRLDVGLSNGKNAKATFSYLPQRRSSTDTVKLSDLLEKFGLLNVLFPGDVTPVFGNHQETVTRKAADKLATCFNSITNRGIDKPLSQRFIRQMLMALFC